MKLREFYEKAVTVGMARDPRGKAAAKADLAAAKKEHDGLGKEERPYFDRERLKNPYPDTRILHGGDGELRGLLVGIDIGEGEILLADRLREKGKPVDAAASHHPGAHAFARLADVMWIQPGLYAAAGVPIGQAEGAIEPRIREVEARVMPANHERAADAARLLDVPLLCLHTVADNCVSTYLTERFEAEEPHTLGDLLDLLHAIPEYDIARRAQTGPALLAGSKKTRAGKIFVEMTGGTEGAVAMYAKLARAGVSTVVGMHFSKEHVDAAKAEHLSLVVAGHISSDNLGVNLLLDAALDPGVEVFATSGFRRVRRG